MTVTRRTRAVRSSDSGDSARKQELLDATHAWVAEHGLVDMSLRPLSAAIGSSPRVLLFLFGSKDGLIRAVLDRTRQAQVELFDAIPDGSGLATAGRVLWGWLSDPAHRQMPSLFFEAYAQSVIAPHGVWGGFAEQSVTDWLTMLARAQTPARRRSRAGIAERTLLLTVLRGALLDLIATADAARTTAAVETHLATLGPSS